MALNNFWNRIKTLFRRSPTYTRAPSTTMQQRPQAPIQPTNLAPTAPPAGPLDIATKMDIIAQAGRTLRVLNITYDGVTRMVEPYSMREKSTGTLLFGFCSIHDRIHSFIPAKIETIAITDIQFSPRWPVEF